MKGMSVKAEETELEIKHCESRLVKPSIGEDPKLKLKVLQPHLRYLFLCIDDTLPVIIAID